VQASIERWRKTRRNGLPMPGELWGKAVCLARKYGVARIASQLRLHYGDLKQRLDAGEQESNAAAEGGFIELDAAQLLSRPGPPVTAVEVAGWTPRPLPPPAAAGMEPVVSEVEICRVDGARLTIRLAACAVLDVPGLAAAFLGRR
jgi:hypothetical protein